MRSIARHTPKTSGVASRSLTVTVDAHDQTRLNSFFKHELGFYNTLIGIFESRVRGNPKSIVNLSDAHVGLFVDLAMHNANLRKMVKDPNNWPELFKQHYSTVFGKNQTLLINEDQLLMFEPVGKDRIVMIPEAKKQMAKAVVEFFREQADILSQPQHSDIIEVAYRTPPSSLSKLEFSTKRHAQIPRSEVKHRYNNELEQSEILTPLNSKPMIIQGFNLNEFNSWTNLIIKQESGSWVTHETPWIADFRNTNNKYLLKYTDVGSKGPRRY